MLEALRAVQTLIVVIGSARAARNTKNPFTAEERQQVIEAMLYEAGIKAGRVRFVHVRDFLYNEALWLAAVQGGVRAVTGDRPTVLVGHIKDESSYYLRSFPEWEFLPTHVVSPLSATDVRKAYFADRLEDVRGMVAPAVHAFLSEFRARPEYAELRAEYDYLQSLKAAWAEAPAPPVFLAADAVVTCSTHLLVVRRATLPGRGQLALPGDLLGPKETLRAAALRAVREETGLGSDLGTPAGQAVFDHPDRSQRGRTVTQAFAFELPAGPLPPLQAAADAAEAFWLPLSEALAHPELFFEDHHAIVEGLVNRGRG